MNQAEFDGTSADRLETWITCQRESTELEIMLIKRLVDMGECVEMISHSEREAIAALDESDIDNGLLQSNLDEANEKLDDIKRIAEEAEIDNQSITEILEILK